MTTENALVCKDLIKEFDDTRALDSLSLTVPRGRIFGLLGPNGSGKTTTIRISLGIYLPDQGSVEVLGSSDPLAVREKIGYLPEERGLYPKMKVPADVRQAPQHSRDHSHGAVVKSLLRPASPPPDRPSQFLVE